VQSVLPCRHPDRCCPLHACRKGDIFVHADLQGAPVTIIKSADPATPVPALTISQAGLRLCVHAQPAAFHHVQVRQSPHLPLNVAAPSCDGNCYRHCASLCWTALARQCDVPEPAVARAWNQQLLCWGFGTNIEEPRHNCCPTGGRRVRVRLGGVGRQGGDLRLVVPRRAGVTGHGPVNTSSTTTEARHGLPSDRMHDRRQGPDHEAVALVYRSACSCLHHISALRNLQV
jgi:hypothetical protein